MKTRWKYLVEWCEIEKDMKPPHIFTNKFDSIEGVKQKLQELNEISLNPNLEVKYVYVYKIAEELSVRTDKNIISIFTLE